MRKRIAIILASLVSAIWSCAGSATAIAAEAPAGQNAGSDGQNEPEYGGKPLSYWLNSLRNRDAEVQFALEAIESLGPEAGAAVPDLTRIIGEPFAPVRIGAEEHDSVVSKIRNLRVRSRCVDALASIGVGASPSAATLIRWALTVRVIPVRLTDAADRQQYIDLVSLDVLERMRVAGAVAEFGWEAIPQVAALLASSDDEQRKLAVGILNEYALPIAVELLKSDDCRQREVGIAILKDMWPVVARDHVIALKAFGCSEPTVVRKTKLR